jgi:hypothetical protein
MYGLENIICRSQSTRTINYQIEGGAFRSGAPCPKEFTLSAKERGKKYDRLTMMMMVVVRIKFK